MEGSFELVPITSQKHDPAWKHCQMFKNGERVQLKCVYCSKLFKGGGIHRIKEHLAGQKGNASACLRVPLDVRLLMQHSLDGAVVKKRKKQKIAEELTNVNPLAVVVDAGFGGDRSDLNAGVELAGRSDVVEPSSSLLVCRDDWKNGERKKKRGRVGVSKENAIVLLNVNGNGNHDDNGALGISGNGFVLETKKVNHHVHLAIGRFLYDIGASFDVVNSNYFLPMVDAIASAGPGVVGPSYHELRGWILERSVEEATNEVDKHMMTWARTGCSVLVDQQNTVMGRTFLSFFVYSPAGMTFLKSVDASDAVSCPDALYELLRQVVEEVGVSNVLQVITKMEEQYIVAGRRLSDVFPSLYWTPCVSHCVDLILQDVAKIEWISETIKQARSLTRFVYNHSEVLNMMRRYTFGLDIIEPGITCSVTNFASLKRIVDLKQNLQSLFTSQEWMDCVYSKKTGGPEMLDLISDHAFWSSCIRIVHLTTPLLRLLRIVRSKKRPAMGYIFAGMYRTKEAIKKELIKREDYLVYWNIIDHWWEQCNHPLHATGFYLNPKFFYSIEGDMPNHILSGMFDCIEKLVPDTKIQDKIIKEVASYKNAAGDFGRKMAVRSRDTLLPDEWWSTYGGSCPNLLRLAVRILSQTCSSAGYTPNRILFDQIHDTRNCLERQRLTDLIFVQHNLRLRNAVGGNIEQCSVDPLSFDVTSNLDEWVQKNDLCFDDHSKPDWMALHLPSADTKLLGPSYDDVEELGTGFDDYEVFNGVKDGEEDNFDEKAAS